MNTRTLCLLIIFLICSIKTNSQVKGVKHVIIFGIDALSIDGLSCAETPNLDFIMNNGAYSLHSRGVMPTVSAPNWASLLMGAGPEQHSITSNEWDPNDPPFPASTGQGKLFPSIFSILKEQRPSLLTAALYDWDKFQVTISQQDLDFNLLTKNQYETITKGIDYLTKKKPALSFFYMTFVDDAGHHWGHGTKEYYSAITEADSLLGVLLTSLKKNGMDETTVIIIVSDHGGVQKGHGGESLAEIEIPMFIYGAGISKGKKITERVNNFDCASTAAYILGLKQPEVWIGKPLKSAFEKTLNEIKEMHNLIKTPQISPKEGLHLTQSSQIKIGCMTKEAKIYYTTDGSEPTTNSSLYTSPIVLKKSSLLKVKAFLNGKESKTATGDFRIVKVSDKPNVSYQYYEGAWTQLPDFSSLTPKESGKVYELSLDSIKHREDGYGIKFTCGIKIENEGTYKFTCISDDGSRLFVDNHLVVNNDGSHSTSEKKGKIKLFKGIHQIELYYFDDTDGEFLQVLIEGDKLPKQILSPDLIYE